MYSRNNKKRNVSLNNILQLSIGLLFLNASDVYAGFCWGMNNTACSVHSSDGEEYFEKDFAMPVDVNTNLQLKSAPFKFRSDCHEDNQGCGGKDWRIRFKYFQHTVNNEFVTNSTYRLDSILKPGSSRQKPFIRDDWQISDNSIAGRANQLNEHGVSGEMTMTLVLDEVALAELSEGIHRFTFTIRGKDQRGPLEVTRDLKYTFKFTIPDAVTISGLDPISLGVFPDHQSYGESDFCVYRRQQGTFNITASSATTTTNVEVLHLRDKKIQGNFINYRVKLGHANDAPENMITIKNNEKYAGYNGSEFKGSDSKECSDFINNSNMKLRVDLIDDFTELSTKPAGHYIDTITLTVSPD